MTDAKCYVFVLTLSTKDKTKLLQHLKSGFRRTINWNKYQSKISTKRPNEYLDYLFHPSFQRLNRFISEQKIMQKEQDIQGIFFQKSK